MKIEEFVGYYNLAKDKKAECEKCVRIDKYVPFLTKIAECDNIVNATMEHTDETTQVISFMQSTPARYLFLNMKLISLYTDIEIEMNDGLQLAESYDKLNKCGALDMLIACLPIHEFKEFSTLLQMCVDDYLTNNRELTSYMDKKMDGLVQMALAAQETETKEE